MVKLSQVIDELVEEKGLDPAVLSSLICEGILAGYAKRYPDLNLRVLHDKKTDEITVEVEKEVVETAEDLDREISLRKARNVVKDAALEDKLWVPFEGTIGRIEIMRAKQVIAQQIRLLESSIVYNQFKDKEGTLVHGTVHKAEHGGVSVKIQDNLAFLPKSLSIPGEKFIVGAPIRAILKEVLPEPRNDNQLILERVSEQFVQQLFELEVPEIFEKLVEIKKIARIPGYKSKMLVLSHDPNIDPVGTCVGVGGVRIRPILKELSNEKIDIIAWTESPEILVKNALKPAEVAKVVVLPDGKTANVWVEEEQRSYAIGKMGQNILLASRLTGLTINLMAPEGPKEPLDLADQDVDIENDNDSE